MDKTETEQTVTEKDAAMRFLEAAQHSGMFRDADEAIEWLYPRPRIAPILIGWLVFALLVVAIALGLD